MSNLTPFNFESNEIRVVQDDAGEPLFVAKDVLQALEYSIDGGLSKYIKHVPDEWKGGKPISTPGGTQKMATLTEQGLYFFVARSDKPKALPFQKWIAGDVIPSIRKTGAYITPSIAAHQIALGPIVEQEQSALAVLQTRLSAASILQVPVHISQQEAVKAVRVSVGIDYEPLLLAAPAQQAIADQDVMLEPEDLARRLGIKDGKTMNLRLRNAGLQVKDNGQWLPTEKGSAHCVRHAWTRGNKSGYNLKWRVSAVAQTMSGEPV